MKTQEVGKMVGVSKQTLYYYENEGLIQVERDNNGYRNYSDEDVQILTIIKYLRDLEISIDDIRLILNGDLSFYEVLQVKSESLKENVDQQERILGKIDTLKKQKIPLISNLKELQSDIQRYPLSYWKSTPTISIGRRLTKGLLLRSFLMICFNVLIATLALTVGIPIMFGRQIAWLNYIIIFFIFLFGAVGFMLADKIPSGLPYPTSRFNFVEFVEEGISYYQNQGVIENTRYIVSILQGNDSIHFQRYDEIESVQVSSKTRYMKPYGYLTIAPPIKVEAPDFTFTFKDGSRLFLLAPMLLNNDAQWVAAIIKEKIRIIKDTENILERF